MKKRTYKVGQQFSVFETQHLPAGTATVLAVDDGILTVRVQAEHTGRKVRGHLIFDSNGRIVG